MAALALGALALGAVAACGVDRASRSNVLPTPSSAPSTGSLELTIGGLNGADGDVLITGPGGFSRTLSASEKLTGLAATTYAVVASPVQSALYDFVPGPSEFLITISAGATSSATVSYVATTGALTVNASGLPIDRTPSISVTGSGTTTIVSANGTTGRLRPGVYVVSAQSVPDVSLRYTAASRAATVTAGVTRSVAVNYDCDTNPFAATSTSVPGYLEFVAVHEVLHLLGLVSLAAPDQGLSGHLTTDSSDLMYAGSARWTPSRIDQTRRNYYNPEGLPGGLGNLVTSPFVITP